MEIMVSQAPSEAVAVAPTAEPVVQSHAVGRFSVPDLGVNVACYDSMEQSVVDAPDSAACFLLDGHTVIGDHVNQGFSALKSCSVGTQARLDTSTGVTIYTCVDVIQGHNTGTDLTDASYETIAGRYPDGLVCYTCNGNWQDVTIVFFMPDSGEQQACTLTSPMQNCETDGHQWGAEFCGWEPDYFPDGTLRDYVYYENRRCTACGELDKTALYDLSG